jgi:hypothetical protein
MVRLGQPRRGKARLGVAASVARRVLHCETARMLSDRWFRIPVKRRVRIMEVFFAFVLPAIVITVILLTR